MSKKIRDFELMSTREICCQLRISSRTLERYRKRPSDNNPFPEPDCSYMGGSNKWLKSKVTEWQQKEMHRKTRLPMSHLNLVRDERGRLRRPDNV
ncbi:excisionase Xis [Salmonella enterica subsp. enterica serovar Richmond]|uniref:Excisionase Xis n=1 Tax=Salmonella enterica TaxID=28901 RepID=A0A759S097_SALER|nr:excisionase Xis [Salmonella enterica subsp. enterica serovar Richmond]EDK4035366.1 excisionase [Salmonella enterica subsp. salamae]EDV7056456.1 excisionase Xis [Salmonella enterica subsp. enterica]HAG1984878.1 excisionase Xis [Salmonella enterica]HAK8244224.1 excisionase Xis [Salmonella enterica]